MLILPGCGNADTKRDETKAIEVKEKAEGSHDVSTRLQDSLKMLYDTRLVLLDSLTGVKNTAAGESPDIDKKIEEQKREIEKLLIQIEENTIVH